MVSVICFIPNQQNLLSSMQSADQAKFLMNNNCVVKPECTCLFQPGSVSGRQKVACWILVYFPAEDAVGHPIPLQEVETLMGDTGDQAGLGEGDTCLAPFFVGDGLHTARIIKCSEERIELLKEYGKILNLRKTSAGDFLSKIGKEDTGEQCVTEVNSHKHVSKWRYVNYLGGSIALGGLTAAAAPVVFTAGGGALVAATLATKVVPILALVGVGSMAAKDIIVEDEDCDKVDNSPTKAAGTTCKESDTATTGSDNSSLFSTTGLSSAVQGVFSWFSGSSNNQGKEEGKESKLMENSKKNNAAQDETLIDLSEDPKAPLHVNHKRSKTVTLDPQREQGHRGQDRVKLENQRLWEERQCKICGDGETAVLFDPCGHMCACVDCSAVQRHCPLCGQFISHHHRVFRA